MEIGEGSKRREQVGLQQTESVVQVECCTPVSTCQNVDMCSWQPIALPVSGSCCGRPVPIMQAADHRLQHCIAAMNGGNLEPPPPPSTQPHSPLPNSAWLRWCSSAPSRSAASLIGAAAPGPHPATPRISTASPSPTRGAGWVNSANRGRPSPAAVSSVAVTKVGSLVRAPGSATEEQAEA